jgi:hypothetical protein
VKEFDFVKLTLWLAAVLSLGLGVGYFVLGRKIDQTTSEIAQIERICKTVGLLAKDIKTLEEEKKSDKTPDQTNTAGINTFFFTQAQLCGIRANEDYTLKPKDPEANNKLGYVDQEFTIDFKKDHPKKRDQIFLFIFNCETQSRRIKLAKAKITLDPDQAVQDLWRADSLTFVRRDPLKGSAPAN